MKGLLNKKQLDYIFFHLNYIFEITQELKGRFIFDNNKVTGVGNILFNLSERDIELNKVLTIDNIPILFPLNQNKRFYYFDNNNLIFEHDILKSAFYLLSGYQEWKSDQSDFYNRFPYQRSIQNKLGIIKKPIVNYYFKILAEAIEQFCMLNNIPFEKKKITNNFIFLLSHDIDLIDNYNYYEVGNKFKQAFGLSKSLYSKSKSFKIFLHYLYHWVSPFSKKNPYWSFEKLLNIERENNIHATYFFLDNDQKHKDSYYNFTDSRISNLIKKLEDQNAEIGLHGTLRSADSIDAMKLTLSNLKSITKSDVVGIRQHTLRFKHPDTVQIQEKAGIKYDSTLGFAAHEGFRNSYCLPFKLYDFENDRIIDVWEFPLIVMDGTIFGYRNLNFKEAEDTIVQLIDEVNKFNGIFTLLWHNSFFEEIIFPGINQFYKKIIEKIVLRKPEAITGKVLLNKLMELN